MPFSFVIPITLSGPSAPAFLWRNRPVAEYVTLDEPGDAGFPSLCLQAISRSVDPVHRASQTGGDDGRPMRAGRGRLTMTPGGGETLTAPAAFFDSPSWALERLFGFAVSHSLARQGGAILHGAAFALGPWPVLILGLSRAGKSTLCALALNAGACVVSDDTVLAGLDRTGAGCVEALRSDLYFREPTQTLLPARMQACLKPACLRGERRWIMERSHQPECFIRCVHPATVWCTRIDRRRSATLIQPMAKSEVLAELVRAASPAFLSAQYPQERVALLPGLTALALRARGFRIRLGQDLFARPALAFHRLLDATAEG